VTFVATKEKSEKPITALVLFTAVMGCALCILCALLLVSCGNPVGFAAPPTNSTTADATAATDKASDVQKEIGFVMGTVVEQTLYTSDATLPATVLELLTRIEEEEVSWRRETSDIARINAQSQGDEQTSIAHETREALGVALGIAADSNGAFDPTVGRLTQLWDFDSGNNIVPSDAQIKEALEGVGYEKVLVQGNTVTLLNGALLDFGAVGKGIGCDQVLQMLTTRTDVKGAVISFGGSSILTYGERDDGQRWRVAIANPTRDDDYLGVLTLAGTNHLSTTGNYKKYFEVNGQRYHHILNPETGYPAQSGLQSVTILCDSGIISEGLSTACFVLGREKSGALLEKYDAEAIFVDDQNRVYLTEGVKDAFELLAEGYEVAKR
jgi:thiamine biosynthesis lipoprotein